ncbi:MAG: hypothetical protein GX115_06190 [Ruminiclostridium sp.]|nr:hypothetical protein [Ruminiclostridium sp.]
MKKFLIVYGLIGIILVTLLICFSSTELPEINQTLYIQATQLSDRVTEEIWPGYSFKSYPVAIRKGNTDYVFHGDKCIKRKAALPIIAATAYKHEGEINIFMPSKADMDSLGQIAEGLSESQEQFFITGFALDKEGISDNRYVAILFHEGLHAYQLEHFKDNLFNAMPDSSHEHEEVLRLVDTDTTIRNLYARENEAFYDILQLQDKGELKGKISRYLTIREERIHTFRQKYGDGKTDLLKVLENYYEKVEGTARYTEARAARLLGDDDLYREYIQSLQVNMDGNEKYYRSGMAMSLIFDELNPAWKEEVFSKPESMFELLADYGRALDEQ